jgi:hypothetical protein
MNKTLDEATELIESMASHNFSWTNERAVHPNNQLQIQSSGQNALEAKLESLTTQLAQLMIERNSQALVPVNQVSTACAICGKEGHSLMECTLSAPVEAMISEVNYAQNQGAYSQSYNPSWRNHPNLSYKNANQQSYTQPGQHIYAQASQQSYHQPGQQNFRPQGQMQHPQQHHPVNQQTASSCSSQSELGEMMKLQKEMFSGM